MHYVLRVNGKFFNMSIINMYALTNKVNDKLDETKDLFYAELEKAYDSFEAGDTKSIIGDMNAKRGKETKYQKQVGTYSLHNETNDN